MFRRKPKPEPIEDRFDGLPYNEVIDEDGEPFAPLDIDNVFDDNVFDDNVFEDNDSR